MSEESDRLHYFAKMQGGMRTFDFSQATAFKVTDESTWSRSDGSTWKDQGKMYKMVLRNNNPMGGVCATICAFWIVFHAQQDIGGNLFTKDRSVWEYLFDDGGLNLGAAQNITIEHLQSTGNQLNYFETFMRKFKVTRRQKTMSGEVISNNFEALNMTTITKCARYITKVNGYKLIQLKKSLNGSGSGHMVAAWSDGIDVLFMDPNRGEYWLPNQKAFEAWFQMYWPAYGKRGYKSLKVHNFVAAMS